MIRGSPSTTRTRRSKALRLFFLWAFATFFCAAFICLAVGDLGQVGEQALDVEARVPDVEVSHRGELAHRLAVGAGRGEDGGAGLLRGEVAVAPGDREARREALDVPLPRPRQGLVEVVDVHHQAAIGGGEDAEVREVGIAACLDLQPGLGGLREVHRHDRRRAAKERERRGEHPPVADRHQLRDAALGLVLEHLDRISPARWRLPFAVARARNLLPRRLAGGCALLCRGSGHELGFGGGGGGHVLENQSRRPITSRSIS